MLNLAEQAPPSPELARANVNVSIAAGFIPHHGLAERYGQRAETIAQDIVDPLVLMQVLNIRGVYFTGTGQWARVDDSLDRALALAEQLGDRREAITTQTTRAIAYHYQGRFDEAIALNQHAQEAATQTGNVQQIGWGMYSRAENMNNIRQPQQALAILDELTHDHKHDMQRSALIRIATAYARAHTQLGDWDAALRYDQQARELLGKTSPNVYSMLESYATFADVYLTLCHTHNTPHNRRAAEQGIGILKRYAAIYPVGQARYRLWQGRLDALKGDHQSARARYRQSRDIAQKFAMAYDAQLAQHYLDASS